MASPSLEQLLHRFGGLASRSALIQLTSRAAVDRALREGRIVRLGRGRYALPTAHEARRSAGALSGVMSHRSAAAYWGWEMKHLPVQPCVTVPRNRKVTHQRRHNVEVSWADLSPEEIRDGLVTSPGRTLVDCARSRPFDEALAIADSALRNGDISKTRLHRLAQAVTGPGSRRVRRVADEADGRAANPFESVLRAIALDVPGLQVTPQVLIEDAGFWARPDLVDEVLQVALEADSFEWHGSRRALIRDCRRYNGLVLGGWRVLRFSWEDVMLRPEYVFETLHRIGGAVPGRAQPGDQGRMSA